MTGWLSPAWTVETLIASGLLMALVLILRKPALSAFGPRIAYALWLLPALRMILPPLPGWRMIAVPVLAIGRHQATVGLIDPASAVKLVQDAPDPHAVWTTMPTANLPTLPLPAPVAITTVKPETLDLLGRIPAWNWAAIVVAVWLAGAMIFFAWQMLRYHRFLARALRDSSLLSRECGIDVLVSPHVSGPVAAGIVRRRILLPSDVLQRYSSAERRLALKHEAAHHDRFDILANLVALTIVALHWWNPLAYRAYRAFRADQELACDATVLAGSSPHERLTYGQAVLKSASGRMPVMACALSHKDQLKQRIGMMKKAPMGAWRLIAGSMLAVAAVGGGLLITASGQAQVSDAPVPPVPPVPSSTPPAAPVPPAAPRIVVHSGYDHRSAVASKDASRDARHASRLAESDARRAEAEARLAEKRAREAGLRAADAGRRAAEAARRAAYEGQRAARRTELAQLPPLPPMPPRIVIPPMPDIAAMVNASLAKSRATMASKCAAKGVTMPANADFGALATCGMHVQETIRISLRTARNAIERDRNLNPDQRTRALAGIDRAIADTERDLRHD